MSTYNRTKKLCIQHKLNRSQHRTLWNTKAYKTISGTQKNKTICKYCPFSPMMYRSSFTFLLPITEEAWISSRGTRGMIFPFFTLWSYKMGKDSLLFHEPIVSKLTPRTFFKSLDLLSTGRKMLLQ